MANYPGSVWSPSAKSAGQTIDASHINDAQDEIVAIESGLTQGTAPLNSSRSTVVALSVSGASTFAVRPVMPPPADFVLVSIDSSVTLGSSALSTVAWTQQVTITNSSMHSTGTNPTRLTPQSTGIYQVAAQIALTAASSGTRQVSLRDSTGDAVGLVTLSAGPEAVFLQAVGYKRFDALGGYIQVVIALSGASTISQTTGVTQNWASLMKL